MGLQDQGSDSSGASHSLLGDIVALASSAGYGIYTTMIRLKVPDEEKLPMQLLLGYIGFLTICAVLPILIIIMVAGGPDTMRLDKLTGEVSGFILLNGLADNVISDYLWARSVLLTSPSIATIGMSITIPFAMLSDWLLGINVPGSIEILGAFFVLIGFIFVNIPKSLEDVYIDRIKSYFSTISSPSIPRRSSGLILEKARQASQQVASQQAAARGTKAKCILCILVSLFNFYS